ncbi:hypothetical protein L6R53_04025 [Myxococcota bacterium]|nr:hypothetical protein [Myxococcota bacterium]
MTLLLLALGGAPAMADDPLFADRDPPEQSSVRVAGSFGLGLGGGTSTAGLSAKYFLRETLAVQGVVGAGYGARDDADGWSTGLGLGADLLFEGLSFAELDDVELGWNVGPGLGLWAYDDRVALAAAGVVGLEACVLTFPLDVVVEYRPRMLLAPDVGFDWFSLSGHIRYYFGPRRRGP